MSNKLHELKGRVASKYRLLLKEISSLNSPLKLDWGSPDASRGSTVFLSKNEIRNAFSIVSKIEIEMSEEVVVNCELLGLDIVTHRYRLKSLPDNIIYSGKIPTEARQQVKHSEINAHYKAFLKKVIETNSISGDETHKWILIRLISNN